MSSSLELEVYKAWKETLSEMLGDTQVRSIEKKVIEKLARSLNDVYSEKLTKFKL